jgi:hypothetical protein
LQLNAGNGNRRNLIRMARKSNSSGRSVCLPKLGLIPLFFLRTAYGTSVTVYYDTHQLYAKALIRWFKVPESWLVRTFTFLSGIKIRRVAESGVVRGSPRLNLQAMKRVVPILESLRPEIEKTGWLSNLSDLIGPTPALAYYHRRFPWDDIWPQTIAATICKNSVGEEENPIVIWSAAWPASWQNIVEKHLAEFGIDFFSWPEWYRRLVGQATSLLWAARVIVSSLAAVMRHGVGQEKRERRQVPLAIEFIESSMLKGRPVDSNYLEDGSRIHRDDILYFLTREQARLLTRNGADFEEMLAAARSEGFQVVKTWQLKYSWSTMRFVFGKLPKLLVSFARLGAPCLARTYWRAWSDFLTYAPLFDTYQLRNFLHTQNPNGCTGGRFDSAIITSLCRRFGARSVGYQNRCIYDSVYEDSFDCYDVYLAWGEAWREVLGDGNKFIDKMAYVGCLHNEGLVTSEARRHRPDQPIVVSIFTGDFGGNLFTRTVTTNLVETCIRLAKKYPGCRFQVKMKNLAAADAMLADDAMRLKCQEVSENFQFLRLPTHDCAATIIESDIVIASAWTTPGSDALILGKRVIFYSEFRAGGEVFSDLPNLIAESTDELVRLFEIALGDYESYFDGYRDSLSRLDPFRDGRTRERILRELALDGDLKTAATVSVASRAETPMLGFGFERAADAGE